MTPVGKPTFDSAGHLFGTTKNGGSGGYGTIYMLTNGAPGGPAVVEQTLYSFPPYNDISSSPGNPTTGVVVDPSGNLFGATGGPISYMGEAYELSPPQAGSSTWTYATIHTFMGGKTDGAYPSSGLIEDKAGNLYGETTSYGAKGGGVVYQLSPPAAGQSAWTETILNSSQLSPSGGLTFDSAGNLFGTATASQGSVFVLQPPAVGSTRWIETNLYIFVGPADGDDPNSGVVLDSSGNIYGATASGGVLEKGTVFELSRVGGAWRETILDDFSQKLGLEGTTPSGSLLINASGTLFGMTEAGGSGACTNQYGAFVGCGTVYELTH